MQLDTLPVLTRIDKPMNLKPKSECDIDIYLGVKLKQVQLYSDVVAWSLSPSKYAQEAVHNCGKHLKSYSNGALKLIKHAPNPFPLACAPEMVLVIAMYIDVGDRK